MTLRDLFFLALVLLTLLLLGAVLAKLVRGQWRSAWRFMAAACVTWAAYLLIGFAVAKASPGTVLAPGQERCFDEMCFRVAAVTRHDDGLHVTVETVNRGRGRTQRESGAEAFVIDAAGRHYWPSRQAGTGLDAVVAAAESVQTELWFALPSEIQNPGLVVDHSYRLNPGRIILGDSEHFGHQPTMIRLEY